MRLPSLFGGSALLLALAGIAPAADGPPDVRTVIVARTHAWCGPSTSDGLYPTNELRQGDRVEVVEELPSGWLAIRPPAGSFSWINMRFVQHVAARHTNYTVDYEGFPVPVLIGSSVRLDRPTKTGVKLSRGQQVRGILNGRTMTDNEGTWLPIEPPEGELRYVRREDVSRPPARPTVVAAGAAKPATSTLPPPPPDGDALWRDAEKAERTGRIADAIRLYRLAGDANSTVNPARSDAAYSRAHWLQQANASSNAPGGSYYFPDRGAAPTTARTTYPLPTDHGGSNAVRLIGPAGSGGTAGQLVSSQASPSANGCLTVSGHLIAAHRTSLGSDRSYLLLNQSGVPLMYVVAGPGVDLSGYLNRNVELCGTRRAGGELRADVLTASQVRAVP